MRNVECGMSSPEEMPVGIRSWKFQEFRIPNFEFQISDLARHGISARRRQPGLEHHRTEKETGARRDLPAQGRVPVAGKQNDRLKQRRSLHLHSSISAQWKDQRKHPWAPRSEQAMVREKKRECRIGSRSRRRGGRHWILERVSARGREWPDERRHRPEALHRP